MKKILVIFIICIPCIASSYEWLQYDINHITNKDETNLSIKLKLLSNNQGKTIIRLPQRWAGTDHLDKAFNSFELETSNAILDIQNNCISISSQPHTEIILKYKVSEQSDYHTFKPKIRNDFFWFTGKTILLTPEFDHEIPINITFRWNTNAVYNSYGAQSKNQIISTTINELHSSLFAGGNFSKISFSFEKNDFNLVMYPKDLSSNLPLIELIKNVVLSQYKTMGGNTQNYLISLLVLENTASMGINLNNAFGMIIEDIQHFSLDTLLYYFAHEHFHTWIGKKITSTDDYESQMWFIEGFNDFCALLNSYESGLISFERYIEIYNQILKLYYTHHCRNIDYKECIHDYWQDEDTQRYPYIAGHIFAQEINYILKESNTSDSLILALKRILERHKDELPLVVNTTDILTLLNTEVYENTSKLWEMYFKRGITMKPNPNLFHGKAYLEWTRNSENPSIPRYTLNPPDLMKKIPTSFSY